MVPVALASATRTCRVRSLRFSQFSHRPTTADFGRRPVVRGRRLGPRRLLLRWVARSAEARSARSASNGRAAVAFGAADQDVVPAGQAVARQLEAGDLAQAPLRAVARDGVADFLRAGEADADLVGRDRRRLGLAAAARLEQQAGTAVPNGTRRREEVRAAGQDAQHRNERPRTGRGRPAQADRLLRRSRGDGSGSDARPWSPCAHGSRGAACARGCWADRSASTSHISWLAGSDRQGTSAESVRFPRISSACHTDPAWRSQFRIVPRRRIPREPPRPESARPPWAAGRPCSGCSPFRRLVGNRRRA